MFLILWLNYVLSGCFATAMFCNSHHTAVLQIRIDRMCQFMWIYSMYMIMCWTAIHCVWRWQLSCDTVKMVKISKYEMACSKIKRWSSSVTTAALTFFVTAQNSVRQNTARTKVFYWMCKGRRREMSEAGCVKAPLCSYTHENTFIYICIYLYGPQCEGTGQSFCGGWEFVDIKMA